MELGDPTATTRDPRGCLDAALDAFENSLAELIDTVETGGLDHLTAEEKVAVWLRFERLRNRQPLIDHRMIADAESSDLPREYCSSTMAQFLVQVLQLSPGDAATRVRAAAAVGTRTSMLGLRLDPVLPRLAALQQQGVVSTEKVAIVERAIHKLTRPDVQPDNIDQAEQLLTEHAAILAPPELRQFATAVVNAADPDGPQPIDDQLQHDRWYLELKQRRDGMWHLAGRLTNTLGTPTERDPGPTRETTDQQHRGHRRKYHPDPRSAATGATTPRRARGSLQQTAQVS